MPAFLKALKINYTFSNYFMIFYIIYCNINIFNIYFFCYNFFNVNFIIGYNFYIIFNVGIRISHASLAIKNFFTLKIV